MLGSFKPTFTWKTLVQPCQSASSLCECSRPQPPEADGTHFKALVCGIMLSQQGGKGTQQDT